MSHHQRGKRVFIRLAAALLCFCALFTAAFHGSASAEEYWAQDSLNKLRDWGVMRGDDSGDLRPTQNLTRAEFAALMNRAFGYDEAGSTPFTDVPVSAWYAQDIAIAYNAGYFNGTSATTASPDAPVTREQATVILARNMRLQGVSGEATEFTDAHALESWSSGSVRAATQLGFLSGYTDGTFRPKNSMTRGEMAKLLSTALGTLINEPGQHVLSGIYGNVTINSPGVVLKDTTIAGDLYITGGVGLGSITLENVRVLGKIIISGSGESNKGDSSVILRNVEADALVLDSMTNQYVTIKAEGDTAIKDTSVRTSAYIEDRTPSNRGLMNITMDGVDGLTLDLAGNIKNVVNRSPGSTLSVAQGTVKELTVDEKARGSSLNIISGAVVKKLNLDVGTSVIGGGDVTNVNINSSGSSMTMLPDEIIIRPGVSGDIKGDKMDTAAGQESSAAPRILAGYPRADDVAPKSLAAVFSTNKSGTVYWAISSITDGSVSEEDLVSPPSYASNILKSGNIKISQSNKEMTAKISSLTSGGSYYISAVLVDARGWRSPVKVVSVTTPDDTVPAFASGYPAMSKITDTEAFVTVMPTKTCKLYYAVLPKGSAAPTASDFKSASVTGNLGYGVIDVTRNTTDTFKVNDRPLEELVSYDLYLWLSDADGAKSSAVKKITFTTVDRTPPEFQTLLTPNSIRATSIGFMFNLNEDGTVYWVAVKEGTEYPKPPAGSSDETVDWTSDQAKLQVSSGMNALKSGKTNAKANADGSFTISGLEAERAYDVYYVAIDKAGNYSKTIYKRTANTLDNIAPTVTQEFTRYAGTNKKAPLANTDVRVIFSEGVQRASTNESLLELYNKVASSTGDAKVTAQENLAKALRNTIKLYNDTGVGQPLLVQERTDSASARPWVIDYRNAVVTMEDGRLVVIFNTTGDELHDSALNLNSGSTYHFKIEDIADTSSAKNLMGVTTMEDFTTVSAQIALSAINEVNTKPGDPDNGKPIDMAFSLDPISTSKADPTLDWDMLIWSDTSVSFDLYLRTMDADGNVIGAGWQKVNPEPVTITNPGSDYLGRSLGKDFNGLTEFPALQTLEENVKYEYAVHFTEVEGLSDRDVWSQAISFKINVVTGSSVNLGNLAANITPTNYQSWLTRGLSSIGTPELFELQHQFTDSEPPRFMGRYPTLEPGDSSVDMTVLLDRPGTIYYVVAPVGSVTTTPVGGGSLTDDQVPTGGDDAVSPPPLSAPGYLDIVTPRYSNPDIKKGSATVGTGATKIRVDGLEPERAYYVYYVLTGTGNVYSDVLLYRFKTTEVTRPVITLELSNPDVTVRSTQPGTVNYMLIVYNTTTMAKLLKDPFSTAVSAGSDLPADSPYLKPTFTVLNAMATDYAVDNVSQGSIFDKYASSTYKDSIAELIRSQTTTTSSVVDSGEIKVPGGNSAVPVTCRNMTGVTTYCFLAVGKSELGSGDAFRAIYPVTLPDNEAPQVTSLTATGTLSSTGNRWTGTVSVIFNENIYFYESSTSAGTLPTSKAIDLGPMLGASDRDDNNFISVESAVSRNDSFITLPTKLTNVNQKTQSITLTFTGALTGSSITFKGNLADEFGNTRSSAPLTITMNIKDGEVTFTVTSAWDAR